MSYSVRAMGEYELQGLGGRPAPLSSNQLATIIAQNKANKAMYAAGRQAYAAKQGGGNTYKAVPAAQVAVQGQQYKAFPAGNVAVKDQQNTAVKPAAVVVYPSGGNTAVKPAAVVVYPSGGNTAVKPAAVVVYPSGGNTAVKPAAVYPTYFAPSPSQSGFIATRPANVAVSRMPSYVNLGPSGQAETGPGDVICGPGSHLEMVGGLPNCVPDAPPAPVAKPFPWGAAAAAAAVLGLGAFLVLRAKSQEG